MKKITCYKQVILLCLFILLLGHSALDFILLRKSLLENVKQISFSSLINASATQLLEKVISRKSIKKISFGIYSDRNDLITKLRHRVINLPNCFLLSHSHLVQT